MRLLLPSQAMAKPFRHQAEYFGGIFNTSSWPTRAAMMVIRCSFHASTMRLTAAAPNGLPLAALKPCKASSFATSRSERRLPFTG